MISQLSSVGLIIATLQYLKWTVTGYIKAVWVGLGKEELRMKKKQMENMTWEIGYNGNGSSEVRNC